MKSRIALVSSLGLLVVLYAGPAAAHGGGLDDLGCHHNRQAGGYHCHRGDLAGLTFESKAEAIDAFTAFEPGPSPPGDPIAAGPDEAERMCPVIGFADIVTHVRDGDTIEVGGLPIRLQGVAAPELNQRGGQKATRVMRNLVLDREVWCDLDGASTFDRCSAICYIAVRDIGAVMVRRGLARDCPSFSGGRYERLELQAAAEGARIGRFYALPAYCR